MYWYDDIANDLEWPLKVTACTVLWTKNNILTGTREVCSYWLHWNSHIRQEDRDP